ncbi:MAG: ABC transporter ATP-binding protein [Patescibacteria group bacterium]|nr:ABC transporter ATP-binding protein [Patescibacteria group bacterium]
MIELNNVWKIYQLGKVELTALKGVSLDVTRGDFVSIMGPSGSGKSTLLNMIGCLDIPTKGKVVLNGKDISKLTDDQLSQLRGETIGFVFQTFNLMPHLTALENVMLPMVFQGKLLKQRKTRAKQLLTSVGLEKRINHHPAELSGGERQRVAIARAFANDPEIVIADEPTGNLDSVTGKKIMQLLKRFHKEEKKTIIVVTHDPNIADYSENIVNIKDGELIINHQKASKFLWKK